MRIGNLKRGSLPVVQTEEYDHAEEPHHCEESRTGLRRGVKEVGEEGERILTTCEQSAADSARGGGSAAN